MTDLPGWALRFQPLSWVHAASVAWTVVPIIAACVLGRRALYEGRADREQRLAHAWAGFAIGVNVWAIVFWHLPGQFDPRVSLPIQPCDIAALVAPVAFLSRWRWPRSVLFFWGIGLSAIGVLFPATLQEGPARVNYYVYWLVHLVIVGSASYMVAVHRYRPDKSDLRTAMGVTAVYFLAMAVVNDLLDANYAFIGRTGYGALGNIDSVAPWPDRAVLLVAFVFVMFIGLWYLARRSSLEPPNTAMQRPGAARR